MNEMRVVIGVGLLLSWWAPSHSQVFDRIAFQSNREDQGAFNPGNNEIFSMTTEGSDQVNLTNHSAQDIEPAWSPDGTKIAFASDRLGGYQIYVMDPDGSNPEQLTQGPGDHFWPAWSPDGSQLAYSSNEQGEDNFDLYVMEADGSDPVNITESPGQDKAPSWSPDGTRIAFSSDRDREPGSMGIAARDILVIDALGGTAENLTLAHGAMNSYHPAWSPIGESIAHVSRHWPVRAISRGIAVTDARGGGRQVVDVPPNGVPDLRTVSWSPDGLQWAISMAVREGIDAKQQLEILVLPASGGEPRNLTQSPWPDLHPTWSPMSAPSSSHVEATTWGRVKSLFRDAAE